MTEVNAAVGRGPASLTKGETLKKRISNNECRMSNVEGMYFIYFTKKTERSETTLRHSIFNILRFAFKLVTFDTR